MSDRPMDFIKTGDDKKTFDQKQILFISPNYILTDLPLSIISDQLFYTNIWKLLSEMQKLHIRNLVY